MIRRASLYVLPALFAVAARAETPALPSAESVRADFRKLLDRPEGELSPHFHDATKDGLTVITGEFDSEPNQAVPTLMIEKAERAGKLPVVVCLHGTGGKKEGQTGLMQELARRGYLAVAIDARYHGERVEGGAKGSTQYNEAAVRAWRAKAGEKQEHPFFLDTAYDLWRLVDYLLTRDDVDPDRIGMIGFSMGGIQIWFSSSVDTRVKVAVPAIGVQSLRWSLDNEQWQGRARTIQTAHQAAATDIGEPTVNGKVCRALWAKLLPGVLEGKFDCPSMIRLFAPRPLLILNGDKDPNCPLPGAKLAFAQAEAAYKAAGAEDKLKIIVAADTGHKVTADQMKAAHEWLDKWLLKK